MQPHKIALVCDWSAPQIGGIEAYIGDLARELRAHGHEPHILTLTAGPDHIDGVRVHRLDLRRIPRWNVVGDPRALSRVRAICERERFDVIHGHSLHSPLAHIAMYVARQLRVPGVLTQHSALGPRATWALRALDRRLGWAAWPTVITAVSSVAAHRTRAAAGRDDVHVVHAGLDLSRWTRQRAASSVALQVVSVSRLFAHKRVDDLLHAIPRVLAAVAPSPRFVIVGDGPERARLERLAAHLGVAAAVSFTGALPRTEVARVLEQSHVFVLPNPDEAFGISALEARALGLPVVARSQSGACDLIEHGRHGYLCPTIDDMAHAITRLCVDEVQRRAMARHARTGLAPFGWGHALQRHLDIYRLATAATSAHAERSAPPSRDSVAR